MRHVEEAGAIVGIILILTASTAVAKLMGIFTSDWLAVFWAVWVLLFTMVVTFIVCMFQVWGDVRRYKLRKSNGNS